jgi:polysaccharide export outer membrane protein
MRRKLISVLIFLVCVTSVSTLRAQNLEPARAGASPPYLIQPNDILEIVVYKEPNVTRKVLVRPDGRISLPLVQDLQAAGLNPAQLKQKIEEILKLSMDAPNVTVIVDAIQSYRVYVMGKVAKPGAIMMEKPINVLQALSLAGGFTDFAKAAEIVIIRGNGEDSTLFRFNYSDVTKSNGFSQNMLLRSGDVIVVP